MNDIFSFLSENWKISAGVASIIAYLGYDKAALAIKTVIDKLKSLKSKVNLKVKTDSGKVEAADIKAINHLRKRAVEVNDKALLLEIKNVAAKFFDLHSAAVIKSDTKST